MYILIGLLITLAAIVLDWQKDKSSFLIALQTNWLKYAAIFVVVAFLTGYLFDLQAVHYIFAALAGAGVYFFWSFLVNLFKKK